MIPYHCDVCDTKFVSKQLALKVHLTVKRLDLSEILQENMIPYHCDVCDTKFISKQLALKVEQKTRLDISTYVQAFFTNIQPTITSLDHWWCFNAIFHASFLKSL